MSKYDLLMPAAGNGSRLGAIEPKQFVSLGGIPMLIHPLRIFDSIPWIGRKIILYPPGKEDYTRSILDKYEIFNYELVEGGSSRQESVRRGLERVTTEKLVTHNAAVALVSRALVEQLLSVETDCVTTAMPQQHNLVKGGAWAEEAVSRTNLQIIDSPQLFKTEVLRSCHTRAAEDGVAAFSDAELLLHYRYRVHLLKGTQRNFKITTPLDHALAELLLERPELCPATPNNNTASER